MRDSAPPQLVQLWRTTTFRLTLLYGLVFAVGVLALLGMVYLQSAVYLNHRVDGILAAQADTLLGTPAGERIGRINDALALNGPRRSIFALFASDGRRLAGNLVSLPRGLEVDGRPLEIPPNAWFPAHARLIAKRLPDGDELVVGRDVNQLRELRAIISSALLWSGVVIICAGLALGALLSIHPLRRLRTLQSAARDIAGGDLTRRMPATERRDELDMFAVTVNRMMDEIERLMTEVKGSTDTVAHDLRTPLTRARAQLHRIQQASGDQADDLARAITEIDEVLERFRALMRLSELEAQGRRAGFASVELAALAEQAAELYLPLAEAQGVRLTASVARGAAAQADPKLLFEAVSNLIDNAIKFAGKGGAVEISAGLPPDPYRIVVSDNGPGVPDREREMVLHRSFRSERDRLTPGAGLGLSIVTAILRLHGFSLELEDNAPGLRAVITCRSKALTY